MSGVIYAVYTWVPESVLEEWNAWHSGVHVPNVLAAPEMRGVVKLRVTETTLDGWRPQYVTLYTLDNLEDYAAYRDGHGRRMREEYDARYAGVGKVARVVMVEELRAGARG
jgi:uncharacterized protein DUF4286